MTLTHKLFGNIVQLETHEEILQFWQLLDKVILAGKAPVCTQQATNCLRLSCCLSHQTCRGYMHSASTQHIKQSHQEQFCACYYKPLSLIIASKPHLTLRCLLQPLREAVKGLTATVDTDSRARRARVLQPSYGSQSRFEELLTYTDFLQELAELSPVYNSGIPLQELLI